MYLWAVALCGTISTTNNNTVCLSLIIFQISGPVKSAVRASPRFQSQDHVLMKDSDGQLSQGEAA